MNFDTCDSSLPFCKRHHAISLLLANDPVLLGFFFSAGKRSVDVGKVAELRDSFALPATKRTLIQLALAICCQAMPMLRSLRRNFPAQRQVCAASAFFGARHDLVPSLA